MPTYVNPGQTKGKDGAGRPLGIIGGVIGGIAGGISGGPGGAAAGYSTGSSIGGGVGGAVDPAEAPKQTGGPSAGAMERRYGGYDSKAEMNQPSAVLRESLAALQTAPPDVQNAYGPGIQDAYKKALYRDYGGMA